MEWQEYIEVNPEVEGGKPVIKGTFLTVEHIFKLYSEGWGGRKIIEHYPVVSADAIRALFQLANSCVEKELKDI